MVATWVVASTGPAALVGAETPTEVVEASGDSGVFVARSRSDFDATVFDDAFAAAKAGGVNLVIVVPADPQPTARAFSLRVRQAGEAIDAVLVIDLDGSVYASVGENFEEAEVRAVEAAQQGLSAGPAADAFVHELTVEVIVKDPALYRQLASIAVKLMIALVVIVAAEILYRQGKKRFLANRSTQDSVAN